MTVPHFAAALARSSREMKKLQSIIATLEKTP